MFCYNDLQNYTLYIRTCIVLIDYKEFIKGPGSAPGQKTKNKNGIKCLHVALWCQQFLLHFIFLFLLFFLTSSFVCRLTDSMDCLERDEYSSRSADKLWVGRTADILFKTFTRWGKRAKQDTETREEVDATALR